MERGVGIHGKARPVLATYSICAPEILNPVSSDGRWRDESTFGVRPGAAASHDQGKFSCHQRFADGPVLWPG